MSLKLKNHSPHTQKNVCVGVDKFLEKFLKISNFFKKYKFTVQF